MISALHAFALFISLIGSISYSRTQKCGPTPNVTDIHRYLATSPIVIHGRLQEMIPSMEKHDFDVVVLITQIMVKPPGLEIPPRAVLQRFFIPSNQSTEVTESYRKFGCIEIFQPNAKYTFLLADIGKTTVHRGTELPIFVLSGPSMVYREEVNTHVLQSLCRNCCKPPPSTSVVFFSKKYLT